MTASGRATMVTRSGSEPELDMDVLPMKGRSQPRVAETARSRARAALSPTLVEAHLPDHT
jgi:hypothetical protein